MTYPSVFRRAVAAALAAASLAQSQVQRAATQSTGFNSTFTLTTAQIGAAQLTPDMSEGLTNIVRFDRSQLAFGGVHEDDFYTLPPLTNTSGPLVPGVLLKTQQFTDTSAYALPPNTALSRILYTTTNFNGTVIPASVFILWPFMPRHFGDAGSDAATKAPVVVWNHPTSSVFPTANPSSHRFLWAGDAGPFALALAGYAVVAPDYAGLGVGASWDGNPVPHQYLVLPTQAHDALYGLRAARRAFPETLADDFVVVGHSQGGGVTWAVAEALHAEAGAFADLLPGYRGAVAGSPTTDATAGLKAFTAPLAGIGMDSLLPGFQLSRWLTPLGLARAKLLQEIEGGISATALLFATGEKVIRDDFDEDAYDAYAKLSNIGGRAIAGPLLVLQGTEDVYVSANVTVAAYHKTCDGERVRPRPDIQLTVVNGTGHVPTMFATRALWMQWVEDRFRGAQVEKGCVRTDLESFLPIGNYLKTWNSFPQWAGAPEYTYETPLGP